MKLPTFDGQKNWNSFIFQFERVAKRYGWDDDERAYWLGESFQDDALDYCSSNFILNDYDQLKNKMTSWPQGFTVSDPTENTGSETRAGGKYIRGTWKEHPEEYGNY